jgi:acetyl-CoA C-acetyltransferase
VLMLEGPIPATEKLLGSSGTILITKAVHELVRADGHYGLVTMCCGGGLGTGTLLRRD